MCYQVPSSSAIFIHIGILAEDKASFRSCFSTLGKYPAITQVIEGELEAKGDVDAFVVTFSEPREFTVYTLGPGELDTVGTLYEVDNYEEVFVAEEDEGSHFGGFMIVESVPAGTYSVHVRGKSDLVTGPYKLYYKAKID